MTAVAPSLTIDRIARRVLRDGRDAHLRRKEWLLLEVFLENQGRVLSQQQLELAVWGQVYTGYNEALRVHLHRLRHALGPGFRLTTLWGMGYRFDGLA